MVDTMLKLLKDFAYWASFIKKQGKLEDAHATSVRAMEISKSMYGNESQQVLEVMGEFTDILRAQRNIERWRSCWKSIENNRNKRKSEIRPIYLFRRSESIGLDLIRSAQIYWR